MFRVCIEDSQRRPTHLPPQLPLEINLSTPLFRSPEPPYSPSSGPQFTNYQSIIIINHFSISCGTLLAPVEASNSPPYVGCNHTHSSQTSYSYSSCTSTNTNHYKYKPRRGSYSRPLQQTNLDPITTHLLHHNSLRTLNTHSPCVLKSSRSSLTRCSSSC